MSYDLVVFEKSKAPNNKKDFMKWYKQQTRWEEDHDYNTIGVSSPNLQKWFMDMIKVFPPMNGEYAPSSEVLDSNEDLEDYLTDYCIGKDIIAVGFAWSLAEEAYQKMSELALEHNVGFFDVSDTEDIILAEGVYLD